MTTISCPACDIVSGADNDACSQCGASLAAAVYILFFRFKNDGKGYKAKSASQKSNAV